ncbi:hypothetical protein OESDEN_10724 [Oesophagostomum dentatum]|uniref:Prolyl 4-hydroxylase alpha subunit Fe(2+) 2OG dioxygenase domain-containing protein n=1 Tax=Oesophagostomum dentatum TaxID=61180 RepID=A0A0B1SZV0_OESDE|nr:hypothetical protein OESDEN_10724 [Oesophagostomum dentatum]
MVPRRDYLTFKKGEKKDGLTDKLGNRFATFTIALKTAGKGGDHIFPAISSLYTMEAGDAIMWPNMTPKREQETMTLHGDCPVLSGEKITATLYLREHNQYLLMSTYLGEYYNYNMLVRPNLKFLRMSPVNFFYD